MSGGLGQAVGSVGKRHGGITLLFVRGDIHAAVQRYAQEQAGVRHLGAFAFDVRGRELPSIQVDGAQEGTRFTKMPYERKVECFHLINSLSRSTIFFRMFASITRDGPIKGRLGITKGFLP